MDEEIKRLFSRFDYDEDGFLSRGELAVFLKESEDCRFRTFDPILVYDAFAENRKTGLSFSEFNFFLESLMKKEEIRRRKRSLASTVREQLATDKVQRNTPASVAYSFTDEKNIGFSANLSVEIEKFRVFFYPQERITREQVVEIFKALQLVDYGKDTYLSFTGKHLLLNFDQFKDSLENLVSCKFDRKLRDRVFLKKS
jgi:hypothetical protein